MAYNKADDPYSYVRAKDFFSNLNSNPSAYARIENVDLWPGVNNKYVWGGDIIKDRCVPFVTRRPEGKIFLIEFMRPTVFRIRFHPGHKTLDDYSESMNPSNLDRRDILRLVTRLDEVEMTTWTVKVDPCDDYVKIVSLDTHDEKNPIVHMELYVRKNNCRIVAIRPLERRSTGLLNNIAQEFKIENLLVPAHQQDYKIVWMTKESGILYSRSGKTTVIEVEKPSTARYLGFGEQGGRQLLKSKVIVDYFNYDNMTYSQVYGQGPLDTREPLYHSEPFWMEAVQHPGHMLKIGNFVDNLSQVCLDVGSKDNSMLRVATRFGPMKLYVFVSDTISNLITSYTSIVGRPRLKPRYVLGYHQGCYGYDSAAKIRNIVDAYRTRNFPLDGIHIDVDIQQNYRTFTVDGDKGGRFENIATLFKDLREQGVKCSTNITPFINADTDAPDYKTLDELKRKEYYIKDWRYVGNAGPTHAGEDRYMLFDSGIKKEYPAAELTQKPRNLYDPQDQVALSTTWNTGDAFRGGVWYGGALGRPGYYPDLNRRDVQKWWGEQYNQLISDGLEFVWQDMTSPCMGPAYGDMKSFPFRLVLSGGPLGFRGEPPVPAIEIWSLYSINLIRATFEGWEKNEARRDTKTGKLKRNFIIGRGGFAGLHRYAGLWTGDNASSWDFLRVSVAQVLALGLSGVTISGGDVGGFEPEKDGDKWANPELLMRWYCAYSLLPWFRNHYNGKDGKKEFQEPFMFESRIGEVPDHEKWMYGAVLPVCSYYVRLRYSLLQLLYDQMFDNLLTGLPIARSLIISNEMDASLFGENAEYLDNEYLVGDDLLVAPILTPQANNKYTRTVYLPRPFAWWQCNLRDKGPEYAVPLGTSFPGGALIPYDAKINNQESQIPWITPMFIKFGAIIPQITPRQYAEDYSLDRRNPISIHSYDMYLDDGVSRDSAPTAGAIQRFHAAKKGMSAEAIANMHTQESSRFGDREAKDAYWKITITQETNRIGENIVRDIRVDTTHRSDAFEPYPIVGKVYNLTIWARERDFESANFIITHDPVSPRQTDTVRENEAEEAQYHHDRDQPVEPAWKPNMNAWVVPLPVDSLARSVKVTYPVT
ncbi:hypothetical protein FRC09_020508 [Ceratobasidium sp. 395]|nr:hypothetical protein FRC09_020508 [Ceratobasidium sp. 395]